MIISIQDFFKLSEELPIIDVRSEKEFYEGHIRRGINIPLLNNAERIAVGTDYKQKGQAEAIKTGFRLVGPRFLEIIMNTERVASGQELLVHCWRGGMRSSNFCQVVGMARIKTHQLEGGYKAYRHAALESFKKPLQISLLGGCTGSGKSEILRALREKGEQVIDLENLANHKGSVFGGLMMTPQPTTEQFQNDLFEEVRMLDPLRRIWVEDESIGIGKIFLPHDFWQQMSWAVVFEMEVDRRIRVERLVREYGRADKEEFLKAMNSIMKKLGGKDFQEAKEKLMTGDMAGTIEILLNYYDKAYRTGLRNKQHRIKSRASWDGLNPLAFADQLISCAR